MCAEIGGQFWYNWWSILRRMCAVCAPYLRRMCAVFAPYVRRMCAIFALKFVVNFGIIGGHIKIMYLK